jgi:hypothetical protein
LFWCDGSKGGLMYGLIVFVEWNYTTLGVCLYIICKTIHVKLTTQLCEMNDGKNVCWSIFKINIIQLLIASY